MPIPNSDVQDRMLFAVDSFDDAHKVLADGTSRDYETATGQFWNAFREWAPAALVGDFSMTTDLETGEINIKFTPAS